MGWTREATPQRVKKIRKKLDESQTEFADRLRIGAGAVRWWEQGLGVPSGPVQVLLEMLEKELGIDPNDCSPETEPEKEPLSA